MPLKSKERARQGREAARIWPCCSQAHLLPAFGLAANTDPNLVNPWGVSSSATGPFWVSDQGYGAIHVVSPNGSAAEPCCDGPWRHTSEHRPDRPGLLRRSRVHDGNEVARVHLRHAWRNDQRLDSGNNDRYVVSNIPAASYTGLALASNGGTNYLYAADNTGSIRVFNTSLAAMTLVGSFTDSSLPPAMFHSIFRLLHRAV